MKKIGITMLLLGILFVGCGNSENDMLPNSPLTKEDFENAKKESRFSKEELEKDYENIQRKCSYLAYYTTENAYFTNLQNKARTDEKAKALYDSIDDYLTKCNFSDVMGKKYTEYEKLFGKLF